MGLTVLGFVRIVGKHWQCVNLGSHVTIGNVLVGMVNIKGYGKDWMRTVNIIAKIR